MSIMMGFVLGSITVVLGACGLATFAFYLMAREVKKREQQRASRPVIVRLDGYRARE